MSRLNRALFPTLGRPTTATVEGCTASYILTGGAPHPSGRRNPGPARTARCAVVSVGGGRVRLSSRRQRRRHQLPCTSRRRGLLHVRQQRRLVYDGGVSLPE